MGGPGRLTELRPTPDGSPLTFSVPCGADPSGDGWIRHPVTIRPDWSLEVPHDLAAERVAVAFGGYASCLELADRALPAARRQLQLLARRRPASLRRVHPDRWVIAQPVVGCCRGPTGPLRFDDPGDAAEHARGTAHQAAEAGSPRALLEAVHRALLQSHTGGKGFLPDPAELAAVEPLVTGMCGGRVLWDAGVHPRLVRVIHRSVSHEHAALPVSFYLGVVTRRPDLAWVRRTIESVGPDCAADEPARGEEDLGSWLAWTASRLDRVQPQARSEYLALGLPRLTITALTDAGVTPEMVRRVMAATGMSATYAAGTLQAWASAGARVQDPADLALLVTVYRLGVPGVWRPSSHAVRGLRTLAAADADGVSDARLTAVLAVAGCQPHAVAALRLGLLDPVEVHAWMTSDRPAAPSRRQAG